MKPTSGGKVIAYQLEVAVELEADAEIVRIAILQQIAELRNVQGAKLVWRGQQPC